jgi:hypothetical protein
MGWMTAGFKPMVYVFWKARGKPRIDLAKQLKIWQFLYRLGIKTYRLRHIKAKL